MAFKVKSAHPRSIHQDQTVLDQRVGSGKLTGPAIKAYFSGYTHYQQLVYSTPIVEP